MDNWESQKPEMKKSSGVRVIDIVGDDIDDNILNFDLTEVQNVVSKLQSEDVPTIAQAEKLQQESLRAADILSEYLAKVHKVLHYLSAKSSSIKNQAALDYKAPKDIRMSIELRKMAAESDPKVLDIETKIAKVKGAKTVLEKKFDIIIKSHHHYKDIANGLRKTIQGYSVSSTND